MHLSILKCFKWAKWIGIAVILMLVVWWMSLNVVTELLKHRELTFSFLTGIDSYKHYFLVMRLSIYVFFYLIWKSLLRKLKPNVSDENIAQSKKFLVRFFIVYELFFGINILAFIPR